MPSKRAFSRPVYDQTITIHSEHAQRLLDRGFHLVVRALYSIDVVLRILGDDAEMDQVEGVVSDLIRGLAEELEAEAARLAKLSEDNGCITPRYTSPLEITVQISSPQLAQYTALIQALDRLMMAMDALWLSGVFTNKQRSDGAYAWRRRLLRVGRRIIDIERRARASAQMRGKGEELAESDGEAAEDGRLEEGDTEAIEAAVETE
jgi:hypothetical protein